MTKVRGFPKPYKLKSAYRATPPLRGGKPKVAKEQEQLSGFVRDMPASDIEERFAKGLDKRGITYWFRLPVGAPRGMPGFNELDFLVMYRGHTAVQIDGEYSHKGHTAKDILNDAKIIRALDRDGVSVATVKHIPFTKLPNQIAADFAVKEMFG